MRNHETTAELDNPLSSSKIGAYSGSIKATFFKDNKRYTGVPSVEINDELRAIICNSKIKIQPYTCLLYTSPSPRDLWISRMPSSA